MNIETSKPTKERIMEAAEEIMLEKGFHSVGLNQILTAVKVPKGSFYHYFKSKDEFGVELLKYYLTRTTSLKREMLLSVTQETNPVRRLFDYLDGGLAYIQKIDGKFPCLVLKMASEVTDLSESMRKELAKGFEDWIGIFKDVLDEAVEKKLLHDNFDTRAEAELFQDLWSGATQRAVINRNTVPVHQAVYHIKSRVSTLMI